ncbi:MAG: M48 family metalloprotease [Pyrinomonadaceae bacterium]
MKFKYLLGTLALAVAAGVLVHPPALAQAPSNCLPPARSATAASIFSPAQESDLGDAIAEHVQRNYRVIDDEEIAGYLRRVGERVVRQLPPTETRYQFFLVDLPDANAFALPGGRIYVTRKLVAFAASEAELAGVLAHEIGHIASRQTASDMTRLFREVLKVTQVSDRRDVFERYNQLVENVARKPGAFRRGGDHGEREQLEADQLGIYAMAAAGYDPQSFATFWDRYAETKGKTGGWLSDLFGTTRPESRRLREILKGLAALPPACAAPRINASAEEFQRWQAAVVNYTGTGRKEALHGVLSKKTLDPPLRGDITHFRFSPDGKYLLAQDDAGINVLTREPFAPLFRIESPEAHPAQFTPDSQQIVFHTPGLRVEFWNVEEGKIQTAREPFVRKRCLQTALAPDGKTLACLDADFGLSLYDTATGTPFFEKKNFYQVTFSDYLFLLLRGILADESDDSEFAFLRIGFSPDSRYFAAGRNDTSVAVDLTTRTAVSLPDRLKRFIGSEFTFIGSDRMVGLDREDPQQKSAVLSFPAGHTLDTIPLGRGSLTAATRGNYLLLRPIKDYPVGVMDLATKKIFMANKQAALDFYDDFGVRELLNGEIALYSVKADKMLGKVALPPSALGRLRASAVSPDWKWLAVSERTRGAVWDLSQGSRFSLVRGFRGAYFGDDAALYADFPKHEGAERAIARLNLANRDARVHTELGEGRITQRGPYLIHRRPAKKEGGLDQDIIVEVRDTRTGQMLWTKGFPKEAPTIWVDESAAAFVLSWPVKAGAAKSEIKQNPALGQRLAALKEKDGDYFLQTLDARTGQPTGALLVETGKGSFRVDGVLVAGDRLIIADTANRVLVYSLRSGEQQGKFFGGRPAVSITAKLLGVENERGQLAIYDLTTLDKRDEFVFSSPIAFAQFSPDGKRLLVLTANQTAYVLGIGEAKN